MYLDPAAIYCLVSRFLVAWAFTSSTLGAVFFRLIQRCCHVHSSNSVALNGANTCLKAFRKDSVSLGNHRLVQFGAFFIILLQRRFGVSIDFGGIC